MRHRCTHQQPQQKQKQRESSSHYSKLERDLSSVCAAPLFNPLHTKLHTTTTTRSPAVRDDKKKKKKGKKKNLYVIQQKKQNPSKLVSVCVSVGIYQELSSLRVSVCSIHPHPPHEHTSTISSCLSLFARRGRRLN